MTQSNTNAEWLQRIEVKACRAWAINYGEFMEAAHRSLQGLVIDNGGRIELPMGEDTFFEDSDGNKLTLVGMANDTHGILSLVGKDGQGRERIVPCGMVQIMDALSTYESTCVFYDAVRRK